MRLLLILLTGSLGWMDGRDGFGNVSALGRDVVLGPNKMDTGHVMVGGVLLADDSHAQLHNNQASAAGSSDTDKAEITATKPTTTTTAEESARVVMQKWKNDALFQEFSMTEDMLPEFDEVKGFYESLDAVDPNTIENVTYNDFFEHSLEQMQSMDPVLYVARDFNICRDMLTSAEVNTTTMVQNDDQIFDIASSCENFVSQLDTAGYNGATFCPQFIHRLNVHIMIVDTEVKRSVDHLCIYAVDYLFIQEHEVECMQFIEEIQIAYAQNHEGHFLPFPDIIWENDFEAAYIQGCENQASVPDQICLDHVTRVQTDVNITAQDTLVTVIDKVCDALGTPLPHPNTTMAVMEKAKVLPSLQGRTSQRNFMSTIFLHSQRYKFGLANHLGQSISEDDPLAIQHNSFIAELRKGTDTDDVILKDKNNLYVVSDEDENVELSLGLGRDRIYSGPRKEIACTGDAWTVSRGVGASIGPIDMGAGISIGAGMAPGGGSSNTNYAEGLFVGVCGNIGNGADLSVGMDFSVGFFLDYSKISGHSIIESVGVQVWLFSSSIGVIRCCTAAFAGCSICGGTASVGVAFPSSVDVSANRMYCHDWQTNNQFEGYVVNSLCPSAEYMIFFECDHDNGHSGRHTDSACDFKILARDLGVWRLVQIKHGICQSHNDERIFFRATSLDGISVRTECGDALLIDYIDVNVVEWTGYRSKLWSNGVNGGGAYCLSTDSSDWSNVGQISPCRRQIDFFQGRASYYPNDNCQHCT